MLKNLVAAWSIPEVRARLLFVIGAIAVFVVGLHIPVPGINTARMEELFQKSGGLLNLMDIFSGGALRKFTIFAMGIGPYINASIVMQLLTSALPELERLQKEGETGRKVIAKYTRYLTIVLSVVQAIGLLTLLSNQGGADIFSGGWLTRIQVIVTLTGGTMFLMWLGESISEKGIGQGISMIIFTSILARMPQDVRLTMTQLSGGGGQALLAGAALVILFLGTVVAVIYVQGGIRRIPIQHAKSRPGQMRAPQSSYLPFKVNTAGVMPIIFAISLMLFPAQIFGFFYKPGDTGWFSQFAGFVSTWTTPGASWFATLMYALLIMGFTYFYSAIAVNITELTENLKKYGSFIPMVRPGRQTQDYLDRVLTRITFAGGVFLAFIGLTQYWIPAITGISTFSLVGGTSILIAVGVALDTMTSLESHLVMRNYEGFIRSSSRRGGRTAASPLSLR